MANPHTHILNPKQISDATRWYNSGYKLTHIAELLGVSRNTVSRAIKGTQRRDNRHPWQDDIDELIAEGHSLEAIKAVFGEVV